MLSHKPCQPGVPTAWTFVATLVPVKSGEYRRKWGGKYHARWCCATYSVADVSQPTLAITSDIVEETPRHAETLIGKHGAAGALDRVHTAFHGYLEKACKDAGIRVTEDAGITALLALLREHHPSLDITEPEEKARVDQVMRGIARIVDTLDPLRNRKSIAHPNVLLPEPEARLILDQIRTILPYLDAKLRTSH